MVKCVICINETVLLIKNRGIGPVSVKKIGEHYINAHGIAADRECLKNYLDCLILDIYQEEFIPLFCPCNQEDFITKKSLAIHQLKYGCDIKINDQIGGARVSFFDNVPLQRNKIRAKLVADEEVDDHYTFNIEENNVGTVKIYEFKYQRRIMDLSVDDEVLPPLSFLEHAVESIRKTVMAYKFLIDDQGGWSYGKMQMIVGINNTQNNSVLITSNDGESDQGDLLAIGPEQSFIASPLNVTKMTFNSLITRQKDYLENKLLESQENGSGWTLHSISMLHLMLVMNPKNISSIGLRQLVGGMQDHKWDMGEWAPKSMNDLILNDVEVEGDGSEDEMEDGANEYDTTDKFVDDSEDSNSDITFYLNRNSKRRQEFDSDAEQEAGPSSKKSRLETIVETYEALEINSNAQNHDADSQMERNNVVKQGRNKKITRDDIDDLEIEDGADLDDFQGGRKHKNNKDYTDYLKDYSAYDAFKPIIENPNSKDFKEKNRYRRKNLTHCILKSILGAMYMNVVRDKKNNNKKKKNKDSIEDIQDYNEFVESLRNGTCRNGILNFQFDVLRTFSETVIKGCYFNEVLHYIRSIEHAMNKTLYLNVFLEQKTVQSCSIYSDKKAFKVINDKRNAEYKIRRPMKLIYPTIVPLPQSKTVKNSMNILIRKPSKMDPLLLHCVTITDINRMFKVVSLSNKETTSNILYICAGCTTSYINEQSYHYHVKNCKTNLCNKVQLLEKTYMKYDYRCARKRGFKSPFHMVFDVETKSCMHSETMEEEMKETKTKSTKDRLRRLVLNSYAITVFAEDLPDIDSFTIYRSLTNKETIKFSLDKLPASLEEFVDEEDLYYRKWVEEEKEINVHNFADLLVADLNLISQAMISFCNNHALEVNRALDERRFDKRALKQETISKHLPCCICKQFFASYTYDTIMNGGVDKEEFKNMIKKEYQMSFRETVLNTIKEQGKVKNNEFLNKVVDNRSLTIQLELENFIYETYLINLLLAKVRTALYQSSNISYARTREVKVDINAICRKLVKDLKIGWRIDQIVEVRKVISDNLKEYISTYLCVQQEKVDVIKRILAEADVTDDEWLLDLIQCADFLKYPCLKTRKVTDFDTVSEKTYAHFLTMYKNVTQLLGNADSLVVHHDHFTGHVYGLAHSFCNLQMRQYNMTGCDIFSHNASFDLKYVMDGMLKNLTSLRGRDYSDKVTFIGNSTEKIRMLFVAQMRFKDSIQIFMDSLDNLARAMSAIQKDKVVEQLSEYLMQNNKLNKMKFIMFEGENALSKEEMIGMLVGKSPSVVREAWKIILKDTVKKTLYDEKGFIKKSPFPYEACSTDDYLTLKRDSLPPKEDYYSMLRQSGVSDADYNYANEIYTRYGMQSVEEFNEFYNVMDAIITSVFIGETANNLFNETGIEIRSCSSMSQFSGIAMLLKSKETPQLPNSLPMYEMITRGIRAGLSSIGKRYAVNTAALGRHNFEILCLVPDSDPPEYYSSTIYKVDENNQYGGAQDDQMPYIGFIERDNCTVDMALNLIAKMGDADEPNVGYGFVATVAMYLPNHLHDKNILYSPMIVKQAPELQWMSPLQLRHYGQPLKKKGEFKKIVPNLKLMSTLGNVLNYCCTDNLLKHLLDNGWILTEVTALVEFKTKDYVRSYVIENQNLRMKTTCMVEKKLRKDMNNTLYGNYCMKVEKHMKQTMIYDELASVSNVSNMCAELNKENPHAPSTEDLIESIKNDISKLEKSYVDGEIVEGDKMILMNEHEDALQTANEMLEAGDPTDDFDENFLSNGYLNKREKDYKPKAEKEYSDVDVQLVTELSNVNTKQIKRIANDFSNNYVSCLVQSEKKDNTLSTLRCNAVKVLDNAKISISQYNISFQRIMEEDGCDVQLIGTDTDSGIYCISKKVKNYEENIAFPDRVDELVHKHMSERMDYSNYSTDHKFYDKTYKKNFHRFQNEHPPPSIVTEAIATGCKEYLLTIIKKDDFKAEEDVWNKVKEMDSESVKYSESAKEGVLKRHKGLSHRYLVTRNDYLRRVHSFNEYQSDKHTTRDGIGKVETYSLRAERGKMFLMKIDKVKMSKLMDKTYIFHDGVTTCPFGHYRLKPIIDLNESASYSQLFSDEHLIKLYDLEINIIKEWPLIRNRMYNYEHFERHFKNL